ncbi:hypothetical protein KW805_00855 [Candidatus Pacearchaeota archaeon]|nr:hypothetical protein [Candidatus Pacearchaeota archaeon]
MKRVLKFWCIVALILILAPEGKAQDDISTSIQLQSQSKVMKAGDDVSFKVIIVHLGNKDRRDVEVDYTIIDDKDKKIIGGKQTVALEAQISLVANIPTPRTLGSGTYTLLVEIRDINRNILLSSASESFFLEKKSFIERMGIKGIYVLGLIILTWMFLLFIYILYLQYNVKKKLIRYDKK